MMEIQTDILATIRMQEAALLALSETVRKAIKTIQPTSPKEAANQTRTALSGDERQLMNQVLAELGVQFNSVDIFEKVKKIKPGFKCDALKRALTRLQLAGAVEKIETGRGMRPAKYQKRFYN